MVPAMKIFVDRGLLIEYEKQSQTELFNILASYDSDFHKACLAEGIQLISKIADFQF
jgi:hypothetical protein